MALTANSFTNKIASLADGTFNITDSDNTRTFFSYTRATPKVEFNTAVDMNSHKITEVSAGTATGDALAYGQSNALFVTPTLGAASATSLTFSSTSGIIGTTTNDSAAAGSVGEYIESVSSSGTNFPTSTNLGDLGNIVLTAGDWDISMNFNGVNAASSNVTLMGAGIGTASGNSATGLVQGSNYFELSFAPGTWTIAAFRVSITGSTTYYLKYKATYSSGPPKGYGRISARRVR